MAITEALRKTETPEAVLANRGCAAYQISSDSGVRHWAVGTGEWMAEIPTGTRRLLATFDEPVPPTSREALVALRLYQAAYGG